MSIQPSNTISRYLRTDPDNLPIRRWAARALLAADLEAQFTWGSLDKAILPLFKRLDLDLERHSLDDLSILIPWFKRQLEDCHGAVLDANDPLTINSARLAKDLSLDSVELALLRFALLKSQSSAFGKALETLGHELTMANVGDLLADILELDPIAVHNALRPDARLRRTGVLPMPRRDGRHSDLDHWTCVPYTLLRQIFNAHPQGFSIEQMLFGKPHKPRLTRRDFTHLGDRLDTLLQYLQSACRNNVIGSNVLLQGPPGTGKTELARWLANSLRRPAIEIPAIDDQNESLTAIERLDTWRLCQGVIPADSQRLVVFDEVEEVLSDEGFASHGFRQSKQFGKGFLNTLLETNPLPTIWITNTLAGVDPAYLRRFDMTLHIPTPDVTVRRRIAKRAFRDLPVEKGLIEMIAAQKALTPAHVEKASRVCRIIGTESSSHAEAVARQVMDGDLKTMRIKPLATKTTRKKPPTLPLNTGVLNTSIDPDSLLESLTSSGFGRLCFYGPPGTGKTAFASEIAKKMGRPLHICQAADILGPYVGMTESNIANAFETAASQEAVLLLDEADSFLQDRRRAEKHWQVTEVNQFLTSLDQYQSYVVCTTNLMEGLDPAALRRFDFKVKFSTMSDAQARSMVTMVLKKLGQKRAKAKEEELQRLSGVALVPGDFAVALRQSAMCPENASAAMIVDTVLAEARLRTPVSTQPIGFV